MNMIILSSALPEEIMACECVSGVVAILNTRKLSSVEVEFGIKILGVFERRHGVAFSQLLDFFVSLR
jgi:hypothetical protein